MGIWLLLTGLALVCLLLLSSSRRLLSGSIAALPALFRFSSGALLLGLAGILLLLIWDLSSYRQSSPSQAVATVSFMALDKGQYIVDVQSANAETYRALLSGDAWGVQARILSITPPLLVGNNRQWYRLESLGGRFYAFGDAANSNITSVRPGWANSPVDGWQWLRQLPLLQRWFGIDLGLQSNSYLPLSDGAVYSVFVNQGGLQVRPANQVASAVFAQW